MPTNTPNLNLVRPLVTEDYTVEVANDNADILDGALANFKVAGQIKFPATQNPSTDPNTLDDYEEGSFTPTIEGTTSSGVGTYSTQSGRYIKIGRLIQVEILLNWSAHTGTGSLRIAGLPFTSLSNAVASIFNANVALTANNIMVGFTNGLTMAINQIPVGGGVNTSVAMDTAGLIYVNVTYMTT